MVQVLVEVDISKRRAATVICNKIVPTLGFQYEVLTLAFSTLTAWFNQPF